MNYMGLQSLMIINQLIHVGPKPKHQHIDICTNLNNHDLKNQVKGKA
jgi:hypothetical protein